MTSSRGAQRHLEGCWSHALDLDIQVRRPSHTVWIRSSGCSGCAASTSLALARCMRSELKSGTQDMSGAEVVSVHEGASSLGRAKLRFEAACNEQVEEQPTSTKFVPKLGAT